MRNGQRLSAIRARIEEEQATLRKQTEQRESTDAILDTVEILEQLWGELGHYEKLSHARAIVYGWATA